MEVEEWKDVKGYEGLYQVSNLGRVKSIIYDKEKILKPKCARGYYQVHLCNKGVPIKTCYIHRLVAEAFIPNPTNLSEVNHKDENKLNNHVSNLEWCTRAYNNNYGTRKERVKVAQRKPILCVETGEVYHSLQYAEEMTGINQSNICKCCKGKVKTAGGYHWRYVDK